MTREEYGEAYQKGLSMTTRFLVSRGLSYDAAQETAQAAWVRGYEQLHQLRDPSSILTWMNSIAYNIYRSNLRGKHIEGEDMLPELSTMPTAQLSAIDIDTLLGLCSDNDRNLLTWHHLFGFKVAEIALRTGLTEMAVRIRLLRARRAARVAACAKPSRKPSTSGRMLVFETTNRNNATERIPAELINCGAPNGNGDLKRKVAEKLTSTRAKLTVSNIIRACIDERGRDVSVADIHDVVLGYRPGYPRRNISPIKYHVLQQTDTEKVFGAKKPTKTKKAGVPVSTQQKPVSAELAELQAYFNEGLSRLAALAMRVEEIEYKQQDVLQVRTLIEEAASKLGI